jgi:HK97 family phage prohead protease
MPDPIAGESEDDFMSRCMSDDEAVEDFPDEAQRFAFCMSKWEEDRVSRSTKPEVERRFIPVEGLEVRQEDGTMSIRGVAAVIGQESQDLGGFVEVIEEGAFDEALLVSDVRALYNHDANYVLGRTKSGTLTLEARADGLHYEVRNLPESRRDVYELIQRGDVSGNSFAFTVERDRWEKRTDGRQLRRIEKVRELFDVGPVVYPAYTQTVVSARALARANEVQQIGEDVERVRNRLRLIALEEATLGPNGGTA